MGKVNRQEGTLAVIASLIVLFSAMWNPYISVGVSIFTLVSFAIWEFLKE